MFFKQETVYKMRISDGSSDVSSSDLQQRNLQRDQPYPQPAGDRNGVQHTRIFWPAEFRHRLHRWIARRYLRAECDAGGATEFERLHEPDRQPVWWEVKP